MQPQGTAVPVTVTALNRLTPDGCRNSQSLRVAFDWHGQRTEQFYSTSCDQTYSAGETFQAFALSNDPSELGPTAEWILHPDEHDPFDFIGPNGLPTVLAIFSLPVLAAGVSLLIVGLVAVRKRSRLAAS
ncbi:hypothetical protein [Sinomonas terrae]|uniref:Uncharacterized protein n=1 Tax=Sinomonas terrae TaxID=2908838 RepID=A0ABS9U770_9MICC|nr:hypothetical protein [Sinomonas terrae]MCH6470354.1 hypothetical protein [Sinomonas terrae]MCH6472519.1 hypothetical protein [Sinomonas terrae]